MKTIGAFVGLAALTAAACGSSDPLGEDDLGNGSQTLTVSAEVSATNQIPNASDPNDFATSFEVRVTKQGVRVDNAIVTITSDLGEVTLTQTSGEERKYRGAQPGYYSGYRLDVIAGDDTVDGVILVGPDVHTFTAPTLGTMVAGDVNLMVEWDRSSDAEAASISTREMDALAIEDSGAYEVPFSALKAKKDEVEDERIRLWREAKIAPTGAVGASSFTVKLRNEIEFLVAATPSRE